MPPIYRPWVSPYGDDDFEWDRAKSLATFDNRDLVFEAARIVFRGILLRRQEIIYTPRRGKCRVISLRPANALETEIYHEFTDG